MKRSVYDATRYVGAERLPTVATWHTPGKVNSYQ
jgi:hypothetical protein